MSKERVVRYSSSTITSFIINVFGALEIVIGAVIAILGILLFFSPAVPADPSNISIFTNLLGFSVGVTLMIVGGIIFINGALLTAVSQTVAFSKQNNAMLRELLNR